jgi:hypothetical protein
VKGKQDIALRIGFHAFGHHAQAQRVRQPHDRFDDGASVTAVRQILDETATRSARVVRAGRKKLKAALARRALL